MIVTLTGFAWDRSTHRRATPDRLVRRAQRAPLPSTAGFAKPVGCAGAERCSANSPLRPLARPCGRQHEIR
ncbi:hypothetical protein DM43_4532 [Burkholderia cepacia]|uniref:Uncharacterized protein n=1 Tax=Burkholderia cepacia TaxID=292 RepID=A0AA88Z9N7_BURCE|nr:hypothetical protein DM43_4532 [Burkholderia cepacia]